MRNKGFTLIELMAVVIIIGVVSMITVSVVNYSIKNAKEKLYTEQITRLEHGVKSWSAANTDLLPNDDMGIVFFDISRLKDGGIVDNELVTDPRTNEELTGCMTIKYDPLYKQYDYKYEDIPCESVSGSYLPIITIGGGTNQYLEVNTEYSFPNITAVDYTGRSTVVTGPIIKNSSNQILTNIDSSVVGSTYKLIYSSTDERLGLTKEETVNLTIRDTIAPTIICGTSAVSYSVTHSAGAGFVSPTCVVKDNSCGINETTTTINGCATTLVPTISTSGLSETIPGTYPITYTAKDSSNNTKVFTVTVVVQDITAPSTPTVVTKLNTSSGAAYNGSTTWTNQNVWFGLTSVEVGSGIKFYEYSINCTGTYTTITPNGTNYYLHSVAASNSYNGNICFRAQDNVDLIGTVATTPVKIDKINPTVTFGTNGNSSWGTNRTTTVTISDADSGVNTSSLEYQWTTSTTAPTEASFTTIFTNGATITTPAGVSGTYYLWILAKDNAGNTIITRSNVFNLDVGVPTIAANNASSTWYASRTATITGTDNIGIAEIRYSWNSNPMNAACTSGGTVTTTGTALTVPGGSNGLYLCIRDNAGLTGTWYSGADQYRVDAENPTIAFSPNGSTDFGTASTITITVSDASSGVNASSLKYQWTTSTTAPTEASFTTTFTSGSTVSRGATGTHYLWILAKDNSGKTSITSSNVFYIWTAWSAWQDAAVTATGTRQVETKLQQQYRTSSTQLVNTGTQVTTWGYPACVSCSRQWYAPVDPSKPWGDTGDKVGNTYFYRENCMRNETVWSGFGAWADTASCAADTGTVDYNCKTVYRYRDR